MKRCHPDIDLVTNPTCPQPGFTLLRRQFVTLNNLGCGQAKCAESLYRWAVINSPARPCGESHQTTRHIIEECPLTAFPGGLRRLHEMGPDAVEWLSKLTMKLWECSKRTAAATITFVMSVIEKLTEFPSTLPMQYELQYKYCCSGFICASLSLLIILLPEYILHSTSNN